MQARTTRLGWFLSNSYLIFYLSELLPENSMNFEIKNESKDIESTVLSTILIKSKNKEKKV